jgi:hypothetical protein
VREHADQTNERRGVPRCQLTNCNTSGRWVRTRVTTRRGPWRHGGLSSVLLVKGILPNLVSNRTTALSRPDIIARLAHPTYLTHSTHPAYLTYLTHATSRFKSVNAASICS